MSDTEAILEANDAFYRALAGGDVAAMDEIWARRAPTSCIHPGWRALPGGSRSWRAGGRFCAAPIAPTFNAHKRAQT